MSKVINKAFGGSLAFAAGALPLANQQITFGAAVDRLVFTAMSDMAASEQAQVFCTLNVKNNNTGAGTFAAPVVDDICFALTDGVGFTVDLLAPRNTFKLSLAGSDITLAGRVCVAGYLTRKA